MIELALGSPDAPRTVLCIGAHCDDIEIGCGGTLLRLSERYPQLRVHWVVLSSSPVRAAEAQESAARFLRKVRHKEVVIKDFRNSFFPFVGAEIKEFFEQVKRQVEPDLVLTHARTDLHQDHRLTSELTLNSFRDHLILEYEIPKYDGDLGAPNFFMPLDQRHTDEKVDCLLECFVSQRDKHWFTRDLFVALMRLRGMECNSPSGFAEAFYCRKAVMA